MNQIRRGALLSYFNLGINILIGLIYTPWMIKSIGQSDYGLYTLAMSLIGLLAFDFGLGNATTKFVCEYLAQGRQDKVDALLGMTFKIYLLLDLLILGIFLTIYIYLPLIYDGLSPSELAAFKTVFIITATFCLLSFPFITANGILTSYEKFVQLKSCDLFQRIFTVVTMAICLLCGYGLLSLVIVNSVAGILTTIIKLLVINKDTPLKINFSFWSKTEFRKIVSFVIWISIIALAQRCIFNIAPSIMAFFANADVVAILGVAITIESYTYLFTNALGGMFLPRVSKIVANNDITEFNRLFIRVGRLEVYVCMFILIWYVVFGSNFITLWVGNTYSLAYYSALLFIIPAVIHIPHEIGMQYLIATNKVKSQAKIFIIMALINLILSFPLTKYYGVIGLSLSIFIAYIIRTISLDIYFHHKLQINILHFYYKSYIVQIIPFLAITICFYLINLIEIEGWTGLIIKSIVAALLYVELVYLFCTNKDEKELVRSLLRIKHNRE